MNEPEPTSDAGPAAESTTDPAAAGAGGAGVDLRPWRLRRPVLAGVVLYGALALVIAVISYFWLREHERGRQDGLLTLVDGLNQSGTVYLDPDRAIHVIEHDVLPKSPDEDVRRRALLLLASAYDSAKKYDESERTYATIRAEWPAGLATGPLIVPWANMLVSANKATRAKELLSPAGATDGYGTAEEVDVVRARVAKALEAPAGATAPAGTK